MTLRETAAFVLAGLGLAAAGYFAHQSRELRGEIGRLKQGADESRRAAEADRKVAAKARQDLDLLGERLEKERKGREAAQAVLAAVDHEAGAGAPQAAASADAKTDTASTRSKRKKPFDQIRGMLKTLMDNPAIKEQMRQGMILQVDLNYAAFLDEMGLSGENREAVKGLLADRLFNGMELGMLLMDDAVPEDQVLKRQDELFADSQEKIGRFLSGGQFARLETFENGIPERMRAKRLDDELKSIGLNGGQLETVRSALLEEERGRDREVEVKFGFSGGFSGGMHGEERFHRMSVEEIRKVRSTFSGENPDADMGKLAASLHERNDRMLARVRPLLTDEQYLKYSKQKESELQMMEMGMKMMGMGEE